ncbi:MAG TPA: formaldehyde-activating enzyme [Acidimicrobiia bacterium]|jgi:5,6,7,8-tetrahydromethanopterin hydro-lyase|nr:formaldehyde-activating enzyme [Acidimicrobiia bacterium]
MTPSFSIGEGFAGEGVNAAHVNTMLGAKSGPVGAAWATALATPRAGHAAFVVVAAPNVPVKPMTLFVNKATVDGANERHGTLTWGAAQAGVAAGVMHAHRKGVLRADDADDLVLVAAVWVNPGADDEEAVFANNSGATLAALTAGRDALPSIRTVLDVGEPRNPYFRA